MVVHGTDLLSEQINFLFIFPQVGLGYFDVFLLEEFLSLKLTYGYRVDTLFNVGYLHRVRNYVVHVSRDDVAAGRYKL